MTNKVALTGGNRKGKKKDRKRGRMTSLVRDTYHPTIKAEQRSSK